MKFKDANACITIYIQLQIQHSIQRTVADANTQHQLFNNGKTLNVIKPTIHKLTSCQITREKRLKLFKELEVLDF